MDTIFLRLYEDKTIPWLRIALLVALLFSFYLASRAAETLAYYVIPTPSNIEKAPAEIQSALDTKQLQHDFDIRIKNKYPSGKIKDTAKGVKQIKVTRYFNSRPVRLNIIETDFKLNHRLTVKPIIAGNTLNQKAKIKHFNEKSNAIISVNGGYFKPQTGVPLGLLMIDERVYTGPIYNRVALGIFEDGFKMARMGMDITLTTNNNEIKIDNINQPRTLSTHTLVYDNLWGTKSPPAPKLGVVFSVKNGRILEVSTSSITIPTDGYVISAPRTKIEHLLGDKHFRLEIKTSPAWNGVKHIISGGPYLIKDGEVYIDVTAQKLTAITGRNPRTAIGYTQEGNIIIITADGREKASVGLTLGELARYMKQLGCVNAMNLDGGSSTVMYSAGEVLNVPATPGGIAISNAVGIIEE